MLRRIVLVSALLLAGCTQRFYQMGAALPGADSDPRPGSSLQSVLEHLGPPQRLSRTPAGWVLAWEAWRVSESAVGASLGFLGVDALTVDWGDARVRGTFLLVSFDRERRVSSVSRSVWDNDVGGGSAVQPLAGIAPVVSVGDLLWPLPQHGWGGSLLMPLPTALNNEHRPGMGSNGLEQRGTPSGIGQRSLEMR